MKYRNITPARSFLDKKLKLLEFFSMKKKQRPKLPDLFEQPEKPQALAKEKLP